MECRSLTTGVAALTTVLVATAALLAIPVQVVAQEGASSATATPAEGYTVHVSAPHIYQGQQTEPVHHWCKVHAPDMIVCLLYDSPDPAEPLRGIEYIVGKNLTRPNVSRGIWNANFHDHALEISLGHVTVHDLPPEEAKKVVDLVSTTDGIIFHLWPDDEAFPTGTVAIDQAVGHKRLTEEEYARSAAEAEKVAKEN